MDSDSVDQPNGPEARPTGMIDRDESAEELAGRASWVGNVLTAFAERPELLERARDALNLADEPAFREAIQVLRGEVPIPDPGPKCDPYVTTILVGIRPSSVTTRCRFTVERSSKSQLWFDPASISPRLFEHLLAAGLIECEDVILGYRDAVPVGKFVSGLCPWGTF
jgi:hypothetical protein